KLQPIQLIDPTKPPLAVVASKNVFNLITESVDKIFPGPAIRLRSKRPNSIVVSSSDYASEFFGRENVSHRNLHDCSSLKVVYFERTLKTRRDKPSFHLLKVRYLRIYSRNSLVHVLRRAQDTIYALFTPHTLLWSFIQLDGD